MNFRTLKIGLMVCAVLCTTMSYADQFDTMRQRLLEQVALGTNFDTSDQDVTKYVAAMDRNTLSYWNSMRSNPLPRAIYGVPTTNSPEMLITHPPMCGIRT